MVVWGFPCESRTLSGIKHEILDPPGSGIFFALRIDTNIATTCHGLHEPYNKQFSGVKCESLNTRLLGMDCLAP